MTLQLDATVPARGFGMSLTVETGETLAVLGPNGAGKSTLLAVIAGLLRPDSGKSTLDGEVLFEVAPRTRSTFIQPAARGVSLLAQDPLLFPHLSVLENVAFGPRSAGVRRAQARAHARRWLEEVEAPELAHRMPTELSGGQAQRVAVARALASNPSLLLLDEPMAALDVSVAPALRRMLRRVLRDQTVIIVTHDILDAFTLADRVVVLDAGSIVEQGPTHEVLERPRSRFTADLAGLNILSGVRTANGIRTFAGNEITRAAPGIALHTSIVAAVRPSAVRVSLAQPANFHVAALPGIILDVEPHGGLVRVRAEEFAADITPALAAELDLAPGNCVWFAFDATDVTVYPYQPSTIIERGRSAQAKRIP
ncbi:ABC transporter ATP-binding protein [Arthrobacter sp. Br18]|uniref:sulfate/molybdate ABC transporter ATP-binding protein n=1 Tax=Arthrobacter sp. Br18 TaxID=1312954 RepID=UPI0004B3EE12|nr:ABC transporter ATP-binding protein [Arthrobacter sp. Br18]